jgi:acyl-CoA thioester hydrolase
MPTDDPRIHTREFHVRYYECDAFGHLNNANYLRYMQEAAFDASARVGFDRFRYEDMGSTWLIYETEIEYLQPILYGDTVQVTTWVIDFHRARSRRAYEFYKNGSNQLAAKAVTDWVYIDRESGKPLTIPNGLSSAFSIDGMIDKFPPRKRFPEAPPPPQGVFEVRRKVSWQEIDLAQHVNNAAYLNYIDDCGMQVIAAHHWPVQRMIREGFAIIIRKHQIHYASPAILDDELSITTWVSDIRRSMATRHYVIHRVGDNAFIASIHSLGVWVELSSGRPIRIPQELLDDFAPNITTSSVDK